MKTSTLILAAGALLALPSCSEDAGPGDGNDGGPGGKADDVDDLDPSEFACANGFTDASQRSDKGQVSDLQRLDGLNDPFARAVLKATSNGCPTDMADIVAKLAVTEPGCTQTSAIVSETGQFQDENGEFLVSNPGYRVVSARGCSGDSSRPRWHMMFSNFSANKNSTGSDPEVIAFDAEKGIFNYYVAGRSGYEWHGDSIDIATKNGNRCGNCHNNGSIIQKELDSPWISWEHFDDISGTDTFYENFAKMTVEIDGEEQEIDFMGRHGALDGASVESAVEDAAEEYAKSGFIPHFLGEKGDGGVQVAELLEPLFCTQEINLQTGGGDTGSVTFRADFFLAREFADSDFNGGVSALKGGGSVSISGELYDAGIARSGQTLRGMAQFGITDTKRRGTYPERSFQDGMITQQLMERGVLDEDLVSDILMIDFTRPLFSDIRCGLLEEAARNGAFDGMTKAEDVTADAIRDGLLEALKDSEVPGAARLVDSLGNPDDNADQEQARNDYVAACNARLQAEGDAFVDDLLLVASNVRTDAIEKEPIDPRGPHHIIEVPDLMVVDDDLPHDGSFFNEQCCIGECAGSPDPDPDPDPEPDPDPMGDGAGNCCDAAPEDAQRPGCENETIETCVCDEDSFCCETNYDDICVGIAKDTCGAEC